MVMLLFAGTLTLKIARKNSARKFLFGNAAWNFTVSTIEAFIILAVFFLLINMIVSQLKRSRREKKLKYDNVHPFCVIDER